MIAFLELYVFVATGIFAGVALALTLVVHSIRKVSNPQAARQQFKDAFPTLAITQIFLTVSCAVTSLVATLLIHGDQRRPYLINTFLFIGMMTYTRVAIVAINSKLTGGENLSDTEIKTLLSQWETRVTLRTAVGLSTFILLASTRVFH
jgi:hypothetical protein